MIYDKQLSAQIMGVQDGGTIQIRKSKVGIKNVQKALRKYNKMAKLRKKITFRYLPQVRITKEWDRPNHYKWYCKKCETVNHETEFADTLFLFCGKCGYMVDPVPHVKWSLDSISDLKGRILSSVERIEDEIHFTLPNGEVYKLYHDRKCCEYIEIDDICGDLQDLVGAEIVEAEEVINENKTPKGLVHNQDVPDDEEYQWTFYKFRTVKGSVTIRWYGEPGFYSVDVDWVQVK